MTKIIEIWCFQNKLLSLRQKYNHNICNMNVKGVIKQRGYTIEKVAEEMGVTPVTLHQTLARNPTTKTLQRIANVIGCSVGEFYRDELEEQAYYCPHCGRRIDLVIRLGAHEEE